MQVKKPQPMPRVDLEHGIDATRRTERIDPGPATLVSTRPALTGSLDERLRSYGRWANNHDPTFGTKHGWVPLNITLELLELVEKLTERVEQLESAQQD